MAEEPVGTAPLDGSRGNQRLLEAVAVAVAVGQLTLTEDKVQAEMVDQVPSGY